MGWRQPGKGPQRGGEWSEVSGSLDGEASAVKDFLLRDPTPLFVIGPPAKGQIN